MGDAYAVGSESEPASLVETRRCLHGCVFAAGQVASRAIRTGTVLSSHPAESRASQRRLLPVSHSLARQERQSQPEPEAECRTIEHLSLQRKAGTLQRLPPHGYG